MTEDQELLREAVREILTEPTGTNDHTLQRRIRWVKTACAAVETGSGDIVEIGALAGDSTVLFCEIAEEHGRNVLVIDTWKALTHDVAGWEYAEFVKKTRRWRESGVLYVLREPSQGALAVRRLAAGNWAFALVDGSHEHDDVLYDVLSAKHARVICVDDMNMTGVSRAFDKALTLLPERKGFQDRTLAKKWEGYII